MGFFGFLKKKEVAPPAQPPLAPPPGMAPPSDAIPRPPRSTELSLEPLPGDLIHDDLHHDNDLDTIPPPATIEVMHPLDAPPAPPTLPELSLQEHETDLPPLPPAQAETPPPPPVETPKSEQKIAEQPAAPPAPEHFEIPDFTNEELLSVQQERPVPVQPVVRERPLPALEPLSSPDAPDEFYVPAPRYQHVVQTIGAMKGIMKKSDTTLAGLGAAIMAHQQPFSGFADHINHIQESLIQIDNIMLNQR